MSNIDLTDKLIEETYDGLIHLDAPISVDGRSILYDGVGNTTSLSVGLSGNGAEITGSLVSGNVEYPISPINTTLFDLVWPINSIYFSIIDINPSSYWPGTTWVRVSEGRYLTGVGTDSTYGVGFGVGNNTGSFKETYIYSNSTSTGVVDHIHGVGSYNSPDNNNDARVLVKSWTHTTSRLHRNLDGDNKIFGLYDLSPATYTNTEGIVTSTPLDPVTGRPLDITSSSNSGGTSTGTINIKPPSFAMYVWQRTA